MKRCLVHLLDGCHHITASKSARIGPLSAVDWLDWFHGEAGKEREIAKTYGD